MTMSVEPLSPALGAEIKGVDLRRPLDDATVKAINAAFDEHVVVVFRDQDLSEADQLRAAGYFGKVHIRRRPANGRTPGGDYDTPFMMVTNIVENGKSAGAFGDGEMWFHHDTSYYPQPHRATFLYSMQLTSSGGETCFSNMYKAYQNIPRALRDRLEGRNVLQVHDYKRRERIDLTQVALEKILHHERTDHHHPSGDRQKVALRQPADVGAHRRLCAGRKARRRWRSCSISPKTRPSSTSTNGSSAISWLGQLVLDPCAQGFSARGAAADAPLHHRGPSAALLIGAPKPKSGRSLFLR